MVPLYLYSNPLAGAESPMAKPKLKQVCGASGAAIGGGSDPKFAEEFAQALCWLRFDRSDM